MSPLVGFAFATRLNERRLIDGDGFCTGQSVYPILLA